jgi:hypothetical protein
LPGRIDGDLWVERARFAEQAAGAWVIAVTMKRGECLRVDEAGNPVLGVIGAQLVEVVVGLE